MRVCDFVRVLPLLDYQISCSVAPIGQYLIESIRIPQAGIA